MRICLFFTISGCRRALLGGASATEELKSQHQFLGFWLSNNKPHSIENLLAILLTNIGDFIILLFVCLLARCRFLLLAL